MSLSESLEPRDASRTGEPGRSIQAGLARLGVRRMLLAIHDASFPSDPDEDTGRGSPATRAAARLFGYARSLGFTGIQLGPQGQTSRDNPSPYDGTIFSRHLGNLPLGALRPGGPFEGLVDEAVVSGAALRDPGGPCQHVRAHDAQLALLAAAHAGLARRPDLQDRLRRFRAEHAGWLDRDGLHAALCATHGGAGFRDWPARDRDLWLRDDPDARAARIAEHAPAIDRYALGQMLVHDEHARIRRDLARHRLVLYGDLQVGYADADAWAQAAAFLPDLRMGAPPSRTNPAGQPWGYPVLDPDQYAGRARDLVRARADKAFAEYDSLRIDHPHGLVCPWVYAAADPDPQRAVQGGARLFESPELADFPGLARYAIPRPDQIDPAQPRHADRRVRALDPDQIDRYAVLFDTLVDSARRHGRDPADLSCEVLSTMPYPLEVVLARYQLGRWRVTQKARLDDPGDVYRAENAEPHDWVMLGNHDTASIFARLGAWSPGQREAWARHLTARLALDRPERLEHPGFLASAMLAELFASRAENVSIFFADLFGCEERFNVPGQVDPSNWTLRLPPDFDRLHRERLAHGAALDIPLAIELASAAKQDRPERR
ncbi:MAG TPA: 4-alpha-glucanotransferase [Kofleriaceae bacterium]|nr:4-alpha-glucanotransferase [Kofleriaceae bacterium]